MSHDEMIAVIRAHKKGKRIESKEKRRINDSWSISPTPIWDFDMFDYRIAREPRKCWVGWENGKPFVSDFYSFDEDSARRNGLQLVIEEIN